MSSPPGWGPNETGYEGPHVVGVDVEPAPAFVADVESAELEAGSTSECCAATATTISTVLAETDVQMGAEVRVRGLGNPNAHAFGEGVFPRVALRPWVSLHVKAQDGSIERRHGVGAIVPVMLEGVMFEDEGFLRGSGIKLLSESHRGSRWGAVGLEGREWGHR